MLRGPVLHDFRRMPLDYRGDQKQAFNWLAAAHARAEATLRAPVKAEERNELARRMQRWVLRFGAMTDRVEFRSSALADFAHREWDRMRIFTLTRDPSGARTEERTKFYAEVVEDAFERLYAEDSDPPTVLVHVTCTGYAAPSGAQRLVARRGWGMSTEVIHAYHMGCYAALPSIRIAGGLISAGKSRIDLVHTELCTLHMNPAQHSAEQLMMQSLFADGVIRYSVVPATALDDSVGVLRGLEVLATREEILGGTETEMTWKTSDHGMAMSLSRDLPQHIDAALKPFFERLTAAAGRPPEEIRKRGVFAVHPGGPRIIDQVRETLGLSEDQVALSNAILKEHGNMSSATLPHIWQSILDSEAVVSGTDVIALAFGPGLTLSGAVLRKRS